MDKPFCEFFHKKSRNTIPPKSFLVRCVEKQNILGKRCVDSSHQIALVKLNTL